MTRTLLTPRQRECLTLASMGATAEQMAHCLGLSLHTVNCYLSDAYRRLGARNRIQAVFMAVRLGEICAPA